MSSLGKNNQCKLELKTHRKIILRSMVNALPAFKLKDFLQKNIKTKIYLDILQNFLKLYENNDGVP
jgi:hypothetical protein